MKLSLSQMEYHKSHTPVVDQSSFYSHAHTGYELLFVYRGEGSFLIEDNEYLCRENALFLIPPGKYHVMHPSKESCYERCVINFSPTLLPPIIDKKASIHQIADEAVRELFLRFEQYGSTYTGEALETLFGALLTEILVSVVFDRGEDMDRAELPAPVKGAIAYIKEHIEEPLSVRRIADALFVSETYLGHLFAKTMNTGLMHYVSLKKMYRARALLQKGYSVTAVCERLGYHSYPTFLRNYRARFGVNPSAEKK